MVNKNYLLKGGLLSALAVATNAKSLLTPIDFQSSLDVYYYFRNGDATASVTDEGIDIEGSFSSNDELCKALDGAELVYSSDKGEDVLLTSNCYSVYHLVDNSSAEISWSSCQEFPFYNAHCAGGSASGSLTSTQSSTATAAENSMSGTETLYLTTVTTSINNIETIYTTYCPISEIIASRSQGPVVGGTTNINAVPVETATYVVTDNGQESTYYSLIPLIGSAGSKATGGAQKTYVDNTDYYKTVGHSSAAATKVSGSETYVLTTVTSTIGNIATIYTTYCPLSEIATGSGSATIASETPAPAGSSSTSGATGTAAAPSNTASEAIHSTVISSVVVNSENGQASTVIIETTYTVGGESGSAASAASTGSPAGTAASNVVAQQGASSSAASIAPVITSYYEGSAARIITSVSLASFVAIFLGFFC